MLLRIWNNWNSHLFIVAMQNYKATLENSLEVSYEIKYITYHSIQHGHFWFLPTKWKPVSAKRSFPGGSGGKESACNAGEPDSIPRSGRSLGEGNDNPLHYSCLENSMDRGAWWAMIHRVTKSWKWLSDFHFPLFKEKMGFQGGTGDKEPTCQCRRDVAQSLGWEEPLEEDVATHFSILVWRIPIDRGARQTTYDRWGCKESDTTEAT